MKPSVQGKTVRIVLADDHDLVRSGIKALLSMVPGVEVIAEARDGRELVTLVESLAPDIVMTDISMPEMDGIAAITEIHAKNPSMRMLVLSMYDTVDFVKRAVASGACGYLMKDAPPFELEQAVRTVMATGSYYSPAIAQRLLQPSEPTADDELTNRQVEILKLIAQGRALHVAVAVGPDFRQCALPAHEWVVARDAAVLVHADHLAVVRVELLRVVAADVALPERHGQGAVPAFDDAAAEVVGAGHLRLLAEDHAHVFEPRGVRGELRARERGAVAALARFGEAEIKLPVGGEARIEHVVEQAPLPARVDLRDPAQRFADPAGGVDDPHPPRPLGDQESPVARKRHGPGVVEARGDGFGSQHLRRGGGRAQGPERHGNCQAATQVLTQPFRAKARRNLFSMNHWLTNDTSLDVSDEPRLSCPPWTNGCASRSSRCRHGRRMPPRQRRTTTWPASWPTRACSGRSSRCARRSRAAPPNWS
jgi:DNA-binding NarL/FixJ family response regulator